MRIPTVLTKCKITSGAAVLAMAVGTVLGVEWLQRWALLIAICAVGLCLAVAIERAAEAIKTYVQKWSHQVFQDGFRSGVEQGREMEATERFLASTKEN